MNTVTFTDPLVALLSAGRIINNESNNKPIYWSDNGKSDFINKVNDNCDMAI